MLSALYTIIIYPLELIVELSYRIFSAVFSNIGVTLIGVSVTITLLCLPLYAVAEAWQAVERNLQKSMASDIKHIKTAFAGDEQYMLLATFYREKHYTPLMQLRQSFGILIQIPFFMAAYHYLSNNKELLGQSFLFIKDLGSPDSLFKVGSFTINILPIAMTLINIISGVIYSKGHPLREKIQIFVMAAVFLIVLYKSPAALVLYWTCNNVFSLVKNIFYKLRNPLKSFWVMCTAAMIAITVYLLVKGFERVAVFVLASAVLLFLPIIIKVCKAVFKRPIKLLVGGDGAKNHLSSAFSLFLLSAIGLAALIGVVIPSFLMTSSPAEYCYTGVYNNPLYFLYNSALQSFGLFVLWPVCIFFLFGRNAKAVIAMLFFTAVIFAITNNFAFPGDYGNVLPEVEFTEHRPFFPNLKWFLLNSAVLLAIAAGIYILLYKGLHKITQFIATIALMCIVGTAAVNVIKVGNFYKHFDKPAPQITTKDKFINLSKTEKNVIVIMVDGATGYMAPHIFENRTALYDDFDGFVYYPNCVSFGPWTIQGAIPLYGGYEYTPFEMNKRRDTPMVDKHNEGLTLQAKVFSDAGYQCTVLDPPYPNYDQKPVDKAFRDIPNTTFRQILGRYNDVWTYEHHTSITNFRTIMIKRNFLLFGIFKALPMIARPFIVYHDFWRPAKSTDGRDLKRFLDNYAALDYLSDFTNTNSDRAGFLIMDNEIKHDQVFLQLPDFTPAAHVDNSAFSGLNKWYDSMEFHVTSAAYIKLGEYFRFLKDSGVYDNTRIIITADHGAITRIKGLFDDPIGRYPFEKLNPVLMIKDFNAKGKLSTDNTFMTNADVPALAFNGVIDNAANPVTKKPIRLLTTEEKNERAIISFSKGNGVLSTKNNGYIIKDEDWYTVHDSIFRASNWGRLRK